MSTRRQGITNRPKAKSKNARKPGPTPRFPAKSNTISRPILLISQVNPHSSRTTNMIAREGQSLGARQLADAAGRSPAGPLSDRSVDVIDAVIPGWCASTRPQMRNCASGNLEILRCAIAHRSSRALLAPRNDRARETPLQSQLLISALQVFSISLTTDSGIGM